MDFIPEHLKPYVFEQKHNLYTEEDHSLWRYVMRNLKAFLKHQAHSSYLEGLDKTGVTIDKIPKIEEMDHKLSLLGWRAIPISGFIPPMVFMEFQSLGILPIARELRSLEHILYTPAPDIIHEAAGHAPMLVNADFSQYLKNYGEIAVKSIFAKEDLEAYIIIRRLSDLKENPKATKDEIKDSERRLKKIEASQRYTSEASFLSRMNWWTVEYGLIGSPPRIFGAGLLSSLEESKYCLSKPKKIPLTKNCLQYSYDITRPQPQLFIAHDFLHLNEVLYEMEAQMSFKVGGNKGLKEALRSQTKNTVELDSGLEISGQLTDIKFCKRKKPIFLKFEGPCKLSYQGEPLEGHGMDFHKEGYSTPLGERTGELKLGEFTQLNYASGVQIKGLLKNVLSKNNNPILLTFENASLTYQNEFLFRPKWGLFDLALAGCHIPSVMGGTSYQLDLSTSSDSFKPVEIPIKPRTSSTLNEAFKVLRDLRLQKQKNNFFSFEDYHHVLKTHLETYKDHWLLAVELLEISSHNKELLENIERLKNKDLQTKNLIEEAVV